ncbi:hypothetical protein LXM25_12710 [Dyadobacter sp. LJ53]|uniref:DUF6934 family protein n=1 Tax=Dyadobacter chenwenxiniae TaxID=2906456 RepID=UPI001F208124|nr:hypothetical protein [Dyadobacter chenwenxiniae]MCF0050926.1 hypothetical protein [Dyadobacter chenwenxiniae]
MKHKFYPYRASGDFLRFTFESISEQRIVRKKAEFVPISPVLYNFAFGDVIDDEEINDLAVTNNKDTYTVLATVIRIIQDFLSSNEDKLVYFQGSTPSRTRMYQIILTKEMANWEEKFTVYGVIDGEMMPFKIDFRFDAFIIQLKNNMQHGD